MNDMDVKALMENAQLLKAIIAIAMLCTPALSCVPRDNEAESKIKPGTSTTNIQKIQYDIRTDSSQTNEEVDLCTLVFNSDSLAVVEIENYELIDVEDDCSGPYANPAYVVNANVLAVLAGSSLEPSMEVIMFPNKNPNINVATGYNRGKTILVGLRPSNGKTFTTRAMPVTINPTSEADIETNTEQNIASFEELVEQSQSMMNNFEEMCGYLNWNGFSEEDWYTATHDPYYFGCEPRTGNESANHDCEQQEDCVAP